MVDRRALTSVDLRPAPALLQQPNVSIKDKWAQYATDALGALGYDESAYSTGQRLANAMEFTPAGAGTAAEEITKAALKGNWGEAGAHAGLGLAGIAVPGARAGIKGAEKLATREALADLAAPAVQTKGTGPLAAKIFEHAEQMRSPKYAPATEPVFTYADDGGLALTKELVPQYSIAEKLPPLPASEKAYPLKGRALPISENVEGISDQIVKDLGPLIQSGQYKPQQFYSTGPVIQGLIDRAGMSPPEANAFMSRWAGQGAATSPRTATPQNLRNASYLMYREAQGDPLTTAKREAEGNRPGFAMMGMHTDLGEQFMKGTNDLWTNPKPGTFQTNWAGNLENLTADTHYIRKTLDYLDQLKPGSLGREWFNDDNAYRLYQEAGGFPKTGVLPVGDIRDTLGGGVVPGTGRKAQSEYQILQQPGLRAAEKLGRTPAEVQAAMWFVGGPRTGLRSPEQTIPDLLNSQIEATAKVTGLAPDKILNLWKSGAIPLAGVGGATAGATSLLSQPGGEQPKKQEY